MSEHDETDAQGEVGESGSFGTEGDDVTSVQRSEVDGSSSSPENADAQGRIVAVLQNEVREHYDKYLRSVADLENYKKRAAKDRSDLLRYAGENLARDLLEVIDNLERAINQMPKEGDPFFDGVRLVLTSFVSILERYGIRGESAIGTSFDPGKHEALASVPTSERSPGTVLEEYRKAYFFKDKLLRPAQVVVAIAGAPAQPAADLASLEVGEGQATTPNSGEDA